MWLPYEFFVEAAAMDGTVPRATLERELSFLKAYITIFTSNSLKQADGSEIYSSETEMRDRAVIKLGDGMEVKSLKTIPPKLVSLVAAMKTFLAQQGGRDRENIHVLLFPAVTPEGKAIVDIGRKDVLNLQLKQAGRFRAASFTWRTPFDALTSVADCPRCKAGLSAKWSYCPYCGLKVSH